MGCCEAHGKSESWSWHRERGGELEGLVFSDSLEFGTAPGLMTPLRGDTGHIFTVSPSWRWMLSLADRAVGRGGISRCGGDSPELTAPALRVV